LLKRHDMKLVQLQIKNIYNKQVLVASRQLFFVHFHVDPICQKLEPHSPFHFHQFIFKQDSQFRNYDVKFTKDPLRRSVSSFRNQDQLRRSKNCPTRNWIGYLSISKYKGKVYKLNFLSFARESIAGWDSHFQRTRFFWASIAPHSK
jgi:hypothetical protein